ncbi:MAG: Ni/Fe hydrogenase subunit gamma [Actinobacteria bacterium]|nr:MAG: Ni/Fe hydrogenase subunit gamma [Actinomycetota bacterium]
MAPLAELGSSPQAMAPAWFSVRRVRPELADTVTIDLVPPRGAFTFAPGQFTMLSVFGIGEIPISISGDPAETATLTQTVRAVGAVSTAVVGLRAGDLVGVRGPFGSSWPVTHARGRDVVIVAGGIGLAPIRPTICAVLAERDRFNRVAILYGARSPNDLLFTDDLATWRARFDLEVLVTVDSAGRGWHGGVGVVTKLIDRAPFDPARTTAFVCGPEVMMRFSAERLMTAGVPARDINVSMERNMQCGIGLCGHCQFGPTFVCKDGPVYRWSDIAPLLAVRET